MPSSFGVEGEEKEEEGGMCLVEMTGTEVEVCGLKQPMDQWRVWVFSATKGSMELWGKVW